tara:strand:+ start:631 stop:1680 length:1050 start_codon:yes stop_codon:yes gene_type:complete
MKVFHFKEKIDSLPKTNDKILPPIHVRIKPTNVCNHSCNYCAYRAKDLQLGKDMVVEDFIPEQKMMEIVDDLIEMGVKAITFSGGGEPFCYPYLFETVKRLSKANIKFATLTNGSRLNGEVAEIFAKHATWLRVSLDGWDDESYASYRNVQKGEFTKIMKNIENFKNIGGKCYLGISIIIDKKNASHIYELIARLKKLRVNSVKVSPLMISNNKKKNSDYHKPIFDITKEQISKAKKEFIDDNFEIFDAYHEQLETFKKDYKWCPYLQILPIIGADLNIYPCQDKAYNLDEGLIGSIKDQSFKEFWFSDKNKFFKINPSIHCNHHCVADPKNKLTLEYLDADKGHLGFV